MQRLCIVDREGKKTSRIPHSEPFTTEIEYLVETPISSDCFWWQLSRSDGVEVMGSGEMDSLSAIRETIEPGPYIATVQFPGGILNAGRYQYRVALASKSGHICDYKYGNYFEIYDDTDYGAVNSGGKRNGVIMMRLQWTNRRAS